MFSFQHARLKLGVILAGAASLAVASQTRAGLTETRSIPHNTEAGAAQIFSHTFGGSFADTGSGFSNGAITATRVDDTKDNVWSGHLTLTPVASFAGSSQSLGMMQGGGGNGLFHTLLGVDQFGYLNTASTTVDSTKFRFVLDSPGTQLRSSSLASENASGDQLVTYKINGLGDGKSHYMLFWEDTPVSRSDRDYNDLVVSATVDGRGGPIAVPLPPSAYLGGAMLVGAGILAMRKRRMALAAMS
jgi:hypothetical protein